MARVSPLVVAPPLVFVALAVLFMTGMQRDDPDALPSTLIGQTAPAVDLVQMGPMPPFTNEVLFQPGVKLVNYWASWCAPCRVEHAQLMALAAEGIPIYGINYKDDPRKAADFLAELGDPYTSIGADPSGRVAIDWGVYGVPETYVIDGEGKILLRLAGPVTEAILEKRVRPAIDAASR